ncbi:MAG TPA: type VI secretion system baseplate subunit TssE [Telluria sp.]|jgi:type VI secretion system protein ImpF
MAAPTPKERLQPALLDRLTDSEPAQKHEPRESRLITRKRLHQAVLRDLAWLLNTTQLGGDAAFGACGYARRSVINFGLPALSGETASTLDMIALERTIKQAILDYEPRIVPASLQVQALASAPLLDQHNIISIQIRGDLWALPVPIELLLRTDVDLETGAVELRDLGKSV